MSPSVDLASVKTIGRVGALAVALGIGSAVGFPSAVARADDVPPSSSRDHSSRDHSTRDQSTPSSAVDTGRRGQRANGPQRAPEDQTPNRGSSAAATGYRRAAHTEAAVAAFAGPPPANRATTTIAAAPALSPAATLKVPASSAPAVAASVAAPAAARTALPSWIMAARPAPAVTAAAVSLLSSFPRMAPSGGTTGGTTGPLNIVAAALSLIGTDVSRSRARTARPVATVGAAAVASGSPSVAYNVGDNWGAGFIGTMAVTAGQANLNGWTVSFTTPARITNIWNGVISSHVGDAYVVTNAPWNGQVSAGQTTSFGFQASTGGTGTAVTGLQVNGAGTPAPTPTPPTVTPPGVTVANATVAEPGTGTTSAVFAVTLSKASATPVSVGYATANGTATAGADYTATSGTLSFAAGVTSQQISVPILRDTLTEPTETFTVTLSNPTGATLTTAKATGTITDTPPTPTPPTVTPPGVTVANVTVAEPGTGTTSAVFAVTLSKASATPVSVGYATANGTATAGADYTATSGTLSFAAGVTSQQISVPILRDTLTEPTETFTVTLSNPTGATLTTAKATGTITDTSTAPSTGSVYNVTAAGPDIVGFNPAKDKLDLGDVSVHNFIVVDTPEGVGFRNPWSGETAVIQGVALGQLTVDNFAPIINDHLRQDLSGALAWEHGVTAAPNTVYMRSHEVGQVDTVAFNPATDVVDFRYFGTREQLSMSDSPGGVIISTAGTGQSLILKGVTKSQLTATNFIFHFAQVREDALYKQLGFAAMPDTQIKPQGVPIAGTNVWPTAAGNGAPPSGQTGTTTVIAWKYGTTTPLAFDPSKDKLDFGWFKAPEFDVTDAGGSTRITIVGNNQTYTLTGVTLAQLQPSNIVALDSGARTKWQNLIYGPGQTTPLPTTPLPTTPPPTLSVADRSAAEGNTGVSTMNFTVLMSKAAANAVSVNYSTSNDTATAGDYVPTVGTLTFAPGETSKIVSVGLNGDTMVELNEQFTLNLSNAVNATVAKATATGTIVNDDIDPSPATPPKVSIADLAVTEGNGEHAHFMFTVTLDKASATPVSVGYATSNGTATAGVDYTADAGTVAFAPGVTTQTVHVGILGDTAIEPNETFTVTLSSPVGLTIARATAIGTILNDDVVAPPTPGLSISDASATEPGTGGMAPGFLHTAGNQIVDSQGRSVAISGVNWFGMESTTQAPHGLWTRSYKDMINQMAGLGFNTIRLPFSSELLHTTAAPNGIDFSKNPDLQGLSGLQVMDAIVAYAGQQGMRVILDHHRSGAGAGTSDNGLWYDSTYTEDAWVADWAVLANRYKNNPTVIGVDLHNEPHSGTWGGGGATDWARAAERAGNAALAVNPNLLVFVEGVETYQGQNYWWGGNLMGVKDRPIVLNVANRVVYSPHDYPNSVFPQTWFQAADFGAGLPAVFRKAWGYIYEQNIAPVYIGEFGTKLTDPKDAIWLKALTAYISGDLDNNGTKDIPAGNQDISWTYWSWNPNSGDTGGILADDWTTVNQNKVAYLTPIEFTTAGGTALAAFTVTLSAASSTPVTVAYATSNGTAAAGGDYVAASGTITFAPGETSKTIAIVVNGDATAETAETFTVTLSSPSGATLVDGSGAGTIADRPASAVTAL